MTYFILAASALLAIIFIAGIVSATREEDRPRGLKALFKK